MPIFRVILVRRVVEESTVYVEADERPDLYDDLEQEESAIETHADNTSTWEGDVEHIRVVYAHRIEKSPGPPVLKLKRDKE